MVRTLFIDFELRSKKLGRMYLSAAPWQAGRTALRQNIPIRAGAGAAAG
jgi:hypothetical protein